MPALVRKPSNPPSPSYPKLLTDIRGILEKARLQIQKINVQTFWKMGRFIHRDILKNKSRADYGAKVIKDLARDLEMDDDFLYDARNFYVENPIFSTSRKLSVSHERELLSVDNQEARQALADQSVRLGWSVPELRKQIKLHARHPEGAKRPKDLGGRQRIIPRRGKPGVYRIVASKIKAESDSGTLWLDLGFYDYERILAKADGRIKAGDIVEGKNFGSLKKIGEEKTPAFQKMLFTYQGHVSSVIDGDTIWVVIEKWSGRITLKKLRFRGINAPEINTRAGKAAKRFLEKLLPPETVVTLTTSKLEKFDRYEVDLFAGDVFVNQLLVGKGFARLI